MASEEPTGDDRHDGRKKVLLIAYHFPPSSAIGGMRPAVFAKHLPPLGWDPEVLTIRERYLEKADPGRLAGLEAVPITRTEILPTLRDLYLSLKKFTLLLRGRKLGTQAVPGPRKASGPERLGQRLKRYVVSLLLTLPDTETGWILPASIAAARRIRKRNIAVIVTSCPPYSVHLVGLILKKMTGVPWAADFRDPWATAGRKTFPTCRLSRAIESRLEAQVMRSADLVITNVERLTAVYRERYPDLPGDRFLCIPNAVNSRNRRGPALPKFERFTLSYTGSIYFGRSPEPVFAAVRKLLASGRAVRDGIRVRLVGQCRFLDERPIEEVIEAHGLTGVVQVDDTVPQAAAREIIERSHIALLLAPEQPYQIPAKFYEYLAIGTPMLAVTGPGATEDLVLSSGCGKAFSSSETTAMAEFIHAAMLQPSVAPHSEDVLSRFDPRQLTGRLAAAMDRIAGSRLGQGRVQDA